MSCCKKSFSKKEGNSFILDLYKKQILVVKSQVITLDIDIKVILMFYPKNVLL